MKKKYIVLCHFEGSVNVNDGLTDRYLLVTSLEGSFDNEFDAMERLKDMIESETNPNRKTDMYFEVKEVYSN